MRNIVQCLEDYDIPLYLSHTVSEVRAENGRLCGVSVSQVDADRKIIPGAHMYFDCDTLLLSVGLIPENELTKTADIALDPRTNGAYVFENMETSLSGVFACGNVVHVHDLVDYVSQESEKAGAAAADYVLNGPCAGEHISLKNGKGVTYTVPQKLRVNNISRLCDVFFRVNRVYGASRIVLESGGSRLAAYKREHMAPGEMEQLRIPAALLKDCGEELEIFCEEA